MRRPTLRPQTYRWITLAAAILLAIIIVTGAAVRLTKSGLGCPVGVSCPASQLQAHGPSSEHATIEHVNRLFTGLVSVAVIVAVLGSLVRTPRRRDLVWLSWGLVAGVFAQIILGQLTVAFDLTPPFVMAHFLVSILLLSDAIVLVHRAGIPDEAMRSPAELAVSRRVVSLGRALLVLAAAVLVSGTFVTGTGPHSGGLPHDDVARIDLPFVDVVRVHSGLVWVFLATVVAAVFIARSRSRVACSDATLHRAARGARRAGRDRICAVLQRHPGAARRLPRRRGGRGVVSHAVDVPRAVRSARRGVIVRRPRVPRAREHLKDSAVATPFAFDREWTFTASPDELWRTLARTDQYQTWWPWLRELYVDGDGLSTATVADFVIQAPLPYQLRGTIAVVTAEPSRLVEASVTGDLEGPARLELRAPVRARWHI